MNTRNKDKNLPEIILPYLYNTYKRPLHPKEYTVWIPKKNGECQIYIKNKWFNFVKVEIENNFKEDRRSRSKEIIVTDKEYKLIKALREYIDEKEESV